MTKQRKSKPRPRRRPERSCVVCRTKQPKDLLVRIAFTAETPLGIDATGRGSGRGAYICRRADCWSARDRRRRIEAALKRRLADDEAAALDAWADRHMTTMADTTKSGPSGPGDPSDSPTGAAHDD